jgi:hypothetical protein
MSSGDRLTSRERNDLLRLAKARARLARESIGARQAELLADVEEQLAASYRFDDQVWDDLTRTAKSVVEAADAQIAARCRELGVPDRFRPALSIQWYSRGENAVASRRAELRKLAQARIEAAGKNAKTEITRRGLEAEERLLTAFLESDEARQVLESLPSVADLMPPILIAELGADEVAVPTAGAGLGRNAIVRQQIAAALQESPNLSAREIARRLAVSPTTVTAVQVGLSTGDAEPSKLDSTPSMVDGRPNVEDDSEW